MSSIQITKDNFLIVNCRFEEKHILQEMGGIWLDYCKSWQVPFTSKNTTYLSDKLNISLTDNQQKLLDKIKIKEDKVKKYQKISETDEKIIFSAPNINANLFNYQKLGILTGVNSHIGLLLGDQPGLGKSIQTLGIATYKKKFEGMKECLLIVPASLKWNWPIEIEKFTNEKCIVIDSKKPDERVGMWFGEYYTARDENGKWKNFPVKSEEDKPFFYITNFELITEDLFGGKDVKMKEGDDIEGIKKRLARKEKAKAKQKTLRPIAEKIWGMVATDECHGLKNTTSKRTKNIKKIKSMFRLGLTGTPIDGRLEELFSIMDWIVPGLLGSKTRFLQDHAVFDFWGNIKSYKDIKKVTEKIRPFFLRRLKENVLKDLPEKIYKNVYISLSEDERKIYTKIQKMEHDIVIEAEPMVAAIRCKQFCDFPLLAGIDECKKHSKLDTLKDTLQEVVKENFNKVIIFSQYSKMCEILIEEVLKPMKLKYLYIWGETSKQDRGEMQKIFNEDKSIDVIIGTEAMSTGLNFQAASYVINYDDNWSPAIMEQREGRALRIGQKSNVTVINFICVDTIEERIRTALYNKQKISNEALGDDVDEALLQRMGKDDVRKLL